MSDTGASMPMPRYRCHKEVCALKINGVGTVEELPYGSGKLRSWLAFADGFAPIEVPHEWLVKHQPELGGYYVVYADGYKSFSPGPAFEEGYTRI